MYNTQQSDLQKIELKLNPLIDKSLSQLEAFSEARSISFLTVLFMQFLMFLFSFDLSVFKFLVFVQVFFCCVIVVAGL